MRTITLNDDDMREPCEHNNLATCGHCNRSWCDTCIPTPSARCPFEYDHDEDQEFAAFLANNDIKIDPNTPLAPHGGCNWAGCTTCFPQKDAPDYEAEFLDEAIVNDIIRENTLRNQVNPLANGPCPVCGEADGFHDDSKHRNNIDPKYLLEKGWHNAK